jgi:tetratricopeptide (TPR) repeat protein
VSGAESRAAAEAKALGEYLSWKGDPVATLAAAAETDPDFVLAHSTIAALNALGGIRGDAPPVRDALAVASRIGRPLTTREHLHLFGAKSWAEGDIAGAAGFWEQALLDDPGDLLALRLAHDTHFFLGALEKLRDIPLSVLPAYENDASKRGFVLGMAAFGLEETGNYAEAEQAGREAVALNPADAWAVHAVAHVLEMQDRPQEGIAWLQGLEEHWTPAALLAVHNWWHAALFLIELGRLDEALALYDAHIRATPSEMVLDLVDAAALLWRLELLGIDVGPRWAALAPAWMLYAEDHVLAFNDLHLALTLAGAGEDAAADALEASIEYYASTHSNSNAEISVELGLPIIRAMRAFRRGDNSATVALLAPIYNHLSPIGGSNAQRDLIVQTLGLAAYRAGDFNIAKAVADERRKLKSGTPRAWANFALDHDRFISETKIKNAPF